MIAMAVAVFLDGRGLLAENDLVGRLREAAVWFRFLSCLAVFLGCDDEVSAVRYNGTPPMVVNRLHRIR